MKKLLFMSVFTLLGTFALANTEITNEKVKETTTETIKKLFVSPEGTCYVWVYNRSGDLIAFTMFHSFSQEACDVQSRQYAEQALSK